MLEQKNKIISEALDEKELLLKEIHHRVKNNLQVISSLLSMQSYQIKDEKALEVVREGKDRVRSMALIHQSLYQDVDLIAVDSKSYIEKYKGQYDEGYELLREKRFQQLKTLGLIPATHQLIATTFSKSN